VQPTIQLIVITYIVIESTDCYPQSKFKNLRLTFSHCGLLTSSQPAYCASIDYMVLKGRMTDVLGKIWKEAAIA
jgi:hypothetical protein